MESNGFSLHTGVSCARGERKKLERLCHYIARPPISNERLKLSDCGQVVYELKTPYRDGTTDIVMFIHWARLLKRVFGIELESCPKCGGPLKIIAAVEQPNAIHKILTHLGLQAHPPPRPPARYDPEREPDFDLGADNRKWADLDLLANLGARIDDRLRVNHPCALNIPSTYTSARRYNTTHRRRVRWL